MGQYRKFVTPLQFAANRAFGHACTPVKVGHKPQSDINNSR
jgi:hypothetical protein